MLLTHILYGGLFIALGSVALKYNYQLVNLTGRQDWIENVLGSGSTYLGYKLISLLMVIGGILYATGLGGVVLNPILQPLSNLFHPVQ